MSFEASTYGFRSLSSVESALSYLLLAWDWVSSNKQGMKGNQKWKKNDDNHDFPAVYIPCFLYSGAVTAVYLGQVSPGYHDGF